uniref:Saccharopine dehydrogenase NADP binding domain-containing protein n=1 Tax=Cyprinus carpio TaxID=7962 RepID=A0A8C1R2V6_CYPCA
MATLTTSSKRPYHIIVFGATGFTGQFVVEEVARTCNEGPGGTLQWAVAGRNRDRLEKTLVQAADALRTCLANCVHFLDVFVIVLYIEMAMPHINILN